MFKLIKNQSSVLSLMNRLKQFGRIALVISIFNLPNGLSAKNSSKELNRATSSITALPVSGLRGSIASVPKMKIEVGKGEQEIKTSAEKLGFPQGKKVLLLHIDDAGMCPEANASTQNYLGKGFLHSAAVMMPCPSAGAMIEWAKSHRSEDIGLHLTLTSEWSEYRWGPVCDPLKDSGIGRSVRKILA